MFLLSRYMGFVCEWRPFGGASTLNLVTTFDDVVVYVHSYDLTPYEQQHLFSHTSDGGRWSERPTLSLERAPVHDGWSGGYWPTAKLPYLRNMPGTVNPATPCPMPFVGACPLIGKRTGVVVAGVPYWLPMILFGVVAAVLFRWDRPAREGSCVGCGYDLRGNTTGRCPECGNVIDTNASISQDATRQ